MHFFLASPNIFLLIMLLFKNEGKHYFCEFLSFLKGIASSATALPPCDVRIYFQIHLVP